MHPTEFDSQAELYALVGQRKRDTPIVPRRDLHCPACTFVATRNCSLQRHINSQAAHQCALHAPFATEYIRPPDIEVPFGDGEEETPHHVIFRCTALALVRKHFGYENISDADIGKTLLSEKVIPMVNYILHLLYPKVFTVPGILKLISTSFIRKAVTWAPLPPVEPLAARQESRGLQLIETETEDDEENDIYDLSTLFSTQLVVSCRNTTVAEDNTIALEELFASMSAGVADND